MLALVVSVGTLIALIVCGLLIRQFLPSYFSEKAKNLASKEVLSHLTHLLESVKARHTSEIERLKADLLAEGQVTERRRRVYEETCVSLRVFSSGGDHSKEANDKFLAAYAAAWLWASDPVLEKLNEFIEIQKRVFERPGCVDQLAQKAAYAAIILAMRKDAGFADTTAPLERFQFVEFAASPKTAAP
jgi:hypothetical protein